MGRWKEAVREELKKYHNRTGQRVVTRQELIDQSLPRFESEFPDAKTPAQTLSRELQELRDLNEVEFLDDQGAYRILTVRPFRLSETYKRSEIHDKYGGNRQGGIAPCANYPYVLLFTGESGPEHGYKDEFREDGSFVYTGEGQVGDMEFKRGNKAIRDHKDDGYELHLFEDTSKSGRVTYVGQYQCDDWFAEQLPDTHGNRRKAIRFKLTPIGDTETDYDPDDLDKESVEDLYRKSSSSSSEQTGSQTRTTTTSTNYPRSELVKEFARKSADGVCQGCKEDAPFIDENGDPFLEVHHLYRRSDGGPDHPDNVLAICPNCHEQVHYGRNGEEFNQELISTAERRNESFHS